MKASTAILTLRVRANEPARARPVKVSYTGRHKRLSWKADLFDVDWRALRQSLSKRIPLDNVVNGLG